MSDIKEYLLSMKNVNKSFPGVLALDDVTLDILPSEIHALVGENGAGKSTLMRALSGVSKIDSGTIYWKGKTVDISQPRDAQKLGISMIHQELAIIPYLDVGKNIFLGREPQLKVSGVIDWKKLYQQAQEQLDKLGLDINPKTPVESLTIAQQQMVEVAKALSMDASLIVMDEPTSALTEKEVDALFSYMKKLRENGVSIIFISHRLNEIQRVSDRITILRDGKWIGTSEVRDLSQNDIVKMMVGREVEQSTKKQAKPSSEVILQIKNLSSGDDVHEVTFDLHKGEILGIAGLVGAGRSALAEAVFGSRKITSGYMKLGHKKVKFTSPKMAIEHGLGLVPEDRKAQGLFLNMAVWQNIVIAGIKKTTRFGFIRKAETQKISTSLVDRLSIKTPSLGQQVKNLSGGNQQKVIIARWLSLKPKILILDEPTRGIDVGAKAEIHNLLKELATEGVGVLMISSELPEILGVSDRILVMKEGHLVAVLDPELSSQDEIMQAAAGSKDENIKED
ncbi:sugar ABC transporter ATP-binding protein [bacterium]|nr:sugar ABC transporter ATP-binding protein [bacterium]MBT4683421.1 sugar ABC transporter ATP-binding protein [Chloroflexota bacterium]